MITPHAPALAKFRDETLRGAYATSARKADDRATRGRGESLGSGRSSEECGRRPTMTAKRILVPLDGSEAAEAAAEGPADLARSTGGSRGLLPRGPAPRRRAGEH